MSNVPVIVEASVKQSSDRLTNTMMAKMSDDKLVTMFFWYPDEITIHAEEMKGLTVEEAYALKQKRDVAYLRSPD